MKFQPHAYQAEAIRRIEEHPRYALFLDMGLGKTVVTLTAIQDLIYDRAAVSRVLIVAPRSVAEATWQDEAEKWGHLYTGFLNARRMPLKAHENLLIFYKHLPTYHPQMTQGKPYTRGKSGYSSNYGKFSYGVKRNHSGERFPRDVLHLEWRSPFCHNFHPTQKPLSLCEYMIRTYTDEGAIILDPFVGSGTIPLAAKNMNRHYLGSEIDSTYYHTALKRLN